MSVGRRKWLPIATACLILTAGGSVGCSRTATDASDTGSQTGSQSQAAEQPKRPTTGTDGRLPTIADYLKQNNITPIQVKPGDPTAPVVKLPVLPNWRPAGPATPSFAYGALVDTNPEFSEDPPTIVVAYSKMPSGTDPAEILKLGPNEVQNLPEFNPEFGGSTEPTMQKFAGFDSVRFGGSYVRNGVGRLISQTTTVIPGKDGVYVLQINVDGRDDSVVDLIEAGTALDKFTTITPS
jgi:hypothetical protein